MIDAAIQLMREGNRSPGGAEIAERAGVSHRSIFRYFDDLDQLLRTAINTAVGEAIRLASVEPIGDGPLRERIEALVERRLSMFDRIDSIGLVARAREIYSPDSDPHLAEIAAMFRDQLRELVAPELARFSEQDREYILDGAQIMIGWDAYDLHRRLLRHDDEWVRRSWTTALIALLS